MFSSLPHTCVSTSAYARARAHTNRSCQGNLLLGKKHSCVYADGKVTGHAPIPRFSLSPLEETRSPHLGRMDLIGGIQREPVITLSGCSRTNPLFLSSQAKYLCFGTGWWNLEFAPVPRQRIMGDCFWDKTSLRSPGLNGTHYIAQAGLKLVVFPILLPQPSECRKNRLESSCLCWLFMLGDFNQANMSLPFPRATEPDSHFARYWASAHLGCSVCMFLLPDWWMSYHRPFA